MTRIAIVMVAITMFASVAHAQLNSNAPTISLSATANESLTVNLSGNAVTWSTGTSNALVPGNASNAGNTTITVTTDWKLKSSRTAVALYAFFASAANAFTGAADNTQHIPSSMFEIKVGAGSFAPVTQTNAGFGGAGASLQIFSQSLTAGTDKNSSRNDVLTFNINLSSAGGQQLAADTYNGTLTIQAQATP